MCADVHTRSFVSSDKWIHARKLVNIVAEPEIIGRIQEHHRSFSKFLNFWQDSPARLSKVPKQKPVKDESKFVRLPEEPYFVDPDDMYHHGTGSSGRDWDSSTWLL